MTALKIADLQQAAKEEGFSLGREEGISLGMVRGREEGAYQNKLETARSLLAYGDSPEKVARCTGLPLETVQELIKN